MAHYVEFQCTGTGKADKHVKTEMEHDQGNLVCKACGHTDTIENFIDGIKLVERLRKRKILRTP